jgi:glycine/D-amino acid oxidase-like deaminating enzyme
VPDVAIVGGGIIGAACAHALARAGATVTLIERDELAAGASGRNQGWFVLPDDPVLAPMARTTLPVYLDVASSAELPVWIDDEPVGHLLVTLEDEEASVEESTLASARANGVAVEELDAAALHRAEPEISPSATGGWLVHHGHRVDPASLTVALALAAKDAGAEIRHHLRVRALTQERGVVRGVVTDDGRVDADMVLVAAGPWSASLLTPLGIDLPLSAARGWLVRIDPRPVSLGHLIEHAGWRDSPRRREATTQPVAGDVAIHGYPLAEVGALVHSHADGTVLVGSSREAWLTPEPADPSVPQRQLQAAIRLVPALAGARVLSSWWGLRPLSPDERPLIGMLGEGLMVATGHGSEGVILGAGTAALVTSMVLGTDPPFDALPFDPLRFTDR